MTSKQRTLFLGLKVENTKRSGNYTIPEYPLIYDVFQTTNFVVVILDGLFKIGKSVVLCNSR